VPTVLGSEAKPNYYLWSGWRKILVRARYL